MSQQNEKNPHQHQSPLHDSSEAKPGMDSLAPEDGSHRPAAEPTPPCTTYRLREPESP